MASLANVPPGERGGGLLFINEISEKNHVFFIEWSV